MARHTDLALELWLDIFRYATYVHEAVDITPIDAFLPQQPSTNVMGLNTHTTSMQTKCTLVSVCHAWRRVSLALLYEFILITSPRKADMILRSFQRTPKSCGTWTRHIQVQTYARGSDSMNYLTNIYKICTLCPNIRMFSGTWEHGLPPKFLQYFSELLGPTLQGISWAPTSTYSMWSLRPDFFSPFRSLRVLNVDLKGDPSEQSIATLSACSKPVVPRLEHVVMTAYPESFLMVTALDLPALCRVTVDSIPYCMPDDSIPIRPFLQVHGHKITYLELRLPPVHCVHFSPRKVTTFLELNQCPNLRDLIYDVRFSHFGGLDLPIKSLRRIGLRGVHSSIMISTDPGGVSDHFETFTPDNFPALETVLTVEFFVESFADRDVSKDQFIWWTDKLGKAGVDLQDGEGVVWECDD